ncbi:MAG: type II secretion system F family protein [Kiritimatiellae bacterium]|nr:type II secretion system F family protein [Kiritimatiellia bacterium]
MKDWMVLALVFVAALGVAYEVLATVVKQLGEESRLRQNQEDQENISPMRRLVTPVRLTTYRIVWACGLGVGLMVTLVLAGASGWVYVPIAAVAVAIGANLPLLYFRWRVKKRQTAFEARILDLTVGLANGLKAGEALPAALESVSGRIAQPMKEELQTVIREYRLGMELPEALERLHERMKCEDLRLLVAAIRLTMQTGGSLTEVLTQMVDTIRQRKEFQEKLASMTAQGRFEAIAMSLAPLFVFVILYAINPPLMKPMVTTGMGWAAIGVASVMVALGFICINKIVTIEV